MTATKLDGDSHNKKKRRLSQAQRRARRDTPDEHRLIRQLTPGQANWVRTSLRRGYNLGTDPEAVAAYTAVCKLRQVSTVLALPCHELQGREHYLIALWLPPGSTLTQAGWRAARRSFLKRGIVPPNQVRAADGIRGGYVCHAEALRLVESLAAIAKRHLVLQPCFTTRD